MTYTSIPNQPLIFNESDQLLESCGCGDNEFEQLVDFTDQLSFQVRSSPCQDSIRGGLITLQSWSEEGQYIIATNPTSLGFYSRVFYPQQPDKIVVVNIVVAEISGTLNVSVSNGGTQSITVAGTYSLVFNTDFLETNNYFSVTISGSTFVGSFNVTGVTTMPHDMYLNLVDANTLAYVDTIAPILTISGDTVTANFELPELEECGKYRLAISDYCANPCGQSYVFNGLFAPSNSGVPGWTSNPLAGTTDWTIDTNSASIELAENDASALESVTELCEGVEYTIAIQVDAIQNARIRIYVNGIIQAGSITATGLQTLTFTPASSGALWIVANQMTSTPSSVEISRVTIGVANQDATMSQYSHILSVGNYSGCEYFKIEGCNGEGQFGFDFGDSSFFPTIRLQGRKLRPQYQTDVDTFRYASGAWITPYADVQKKWTFAFSQLPEYVLDFLSVAVYFDNLYINGQLYFPLDGEFPEVAYNDANDLGELRIDLALKDNKVRKTRCIGTDAECLPTIIDALAGDFIITEQDVVMQTQDGDNMIVE